MLELHRSINLNIQGYFLKYIGLSFLRKLSHTMDRQGRKEMFYLTTHSTHFIYGYMASDIWLWTILIVRKETRCRHIGYSFRLTARVLLYAPSHRQDSTYHGLCYTSRGALAGTRNSSMGPPHEGSIRRPIAPWANALTKELHLDPWTDKCKMIFVLQVITCSSVVRAFAHDAMGHRIDPSCSGPIELFLVQASAPRLV